MITKEQIQEVLHVWHYRDEYPGNIPKLETFLQKKWVGLATEIFLAAIGSGFQDMEQKLLDPQNLITFDKIDTWVYFCAGYAGVPGTAFEFKKAYQEEEGA